MQRPGNRPIQTRHLPQKFFLRRPVRRTQPRRSLSHDLERLRPRKFRHYAADLVEQPYRVASRKHQRPLIRSIREILLFAVVGMLLNFRWGLRRFPATRLEPPFPGSIYAPDRPPPLVIHPEINFRLRLPPPRP